MGKEITICVVGHKKFDLLIKDENYISLGVGSNNHNIGSMKTDDEGINISNKNKNYCELTGLYWMWKNVNSLYYGLMHYRRYLCHTFPIFFGQYKPYSSEKLVSILAKYDVILPRRVNIAGFSLRKMKHNCLDYYDFYKKCGLKQIDLDTTYEIMKEKFPEYADAYFKAIHSKKIHYANVIVTRKEIFNDYCTFLFSVLDELEKRLDISTYDTNQQRVFGYVSELLVDTYFVYHKQFKIKELPLINFEYSKKHRIYGYLRRRA